MKITASEPAFPSEEGMFGGLTIREYFAAKAMASMIVGGNPAATNKEDLAQHAVQYADALIAELAK